MKSCVTVSLLIAGLIVTCTARNIDLDINQDQGSPSSEESSENDEWIEQFEIDCYVKTGSSEAFEAVVASFTTCYVEKLDGINLLDDLYHLNASTRHVFVSKYCPLIRNELPCLEQPIQELSKCVDDDEVLSLRGMYNAVPEALDLICANDGEILFHEGTSLSACMMDIFNYWDECEDLLSDSTNTTALSIFREAQCEELSQVRNCMQTKFNECNGPRLMEVFDVFWRAELKNSSCRN